MVPVERYRRVQGFDHVDRRGEAVPSPPLGAGIIARCPPAPDGTVAL